LKTTRRRVARLVDGSGEGKEEGTEVDERRAMVEAGWGERRTEGVSLAKEEIRTLM
jgi:hypothetical protein